MVKTFTFAQISNKIDDVYEYLDARQLKLSGDYKSIDDLYGIYQEVDTLYKKLGHLRSAFGKSVVDVIDQKQSDIVKQVVLTCDSPEELIKFTNRIRTLNQQLHHQVDDNSLLSLDETDSTDDTPKSTPDTTSDTTPDAAENDPRSYVEPDQH